MAIDSVRAMMTSIFILLATGLASFCCNGEELNGFDGPVERMAMNTKNYAFAWFPSVQQCGQWCDRSKKCMSFSWGLRGNVVLLVTDGLQTYRYGHCVVSSVNRTEAAIESFPNYDYYEELAEGPSVDPDSRSIAGFLGPFEGTATSAFDDINEEAYEVENAAACAQMCAGMKECRSFDYGARGSVVGDCWLSRVDRESAGTMFTVWQLYDYYEKILETIVLEVEERSELSILSGALAATNLPDLLANSGPFTFFAPSDEAFRAAGINSAAELLALPDATAVLEYHLALGRFEASALQAGDQLLTAHGEKAVVTNPDGSILVDGVGVTTADIECSNGVVHIMNGILSPPSSAQEPIIDMLATRGYTELRQALLASNLLDGMTEWTLFAPSDIALRAFRLTEGITDANAFLTSDEMREILRRHIIPGQSVYTMVADGGDREFTAMGGNTLVLTRTPGGGYFIKSDGAVAAVGPFDLVATDGVLHVIDRVLAEPDRTSPVPGRQREETSSGSSDDDGVAVGVIIAAVCGALIVVCLGFAAVFMWHRRQSSKVPTTNVQQDGVHVVMGKPVPGQENPSSSAAAGSSDAAGGKAGGKEGGKGTAQEDEHLDV